MSPAPCWYFLPVGKSLVDITNSHVRGGSAQCLDGENHALTLARLTTRFAAYLWYSQLCKVLS